MATTPPSPNAQSTPVLVLGLGGTGIAVQRKLKRQLLERLGYVPEYIRFLGIDTTEQEELSQADPLLEPSEFLNLGNPPFQISQMVRMRNENPSFAWIPDGVPPFEITNGAGMRRLYGLMAYFWKGGIIINRLKDAISRLYAAEATGIQTGACRVFVVSSICGGTGTGMFLDIAYLAKSQIVGHGVQCYGFLFLPSAFQQLRGKPRDWERIHANGYAALKELNYYMQNSFEQTEFYIPDPKHPKLTLTSSPFEFCSLIGGSNRSGRHVTHSEQLYDRTAHFLYLNTTPIGNHIRNVVVINAGGPSHSYASFGSSSMPLPQASYIWHYLQSISREMMEDIFNTEAGSDRTTVTPDDVFAGKDQYVVLQAMMRGELVKTDADGDANNILRGDVSCTSQGEADDQIRVWFDELKRAEPTANRKLDAQADRLREQLKDAVQTKLDQGWTAQTGTLCYADALLESVIERLREIGPMLRRPGAISLEDVKRKHLSREGIGGKIMERRSPQSRALAFREDALKAWNDRNFINLAISFRKALADAIGTIESWRRQLPKTGSLSAADIEQLDKALEKVLNSTGAQDGSTAYRQLQSSGTVTRQVSSDYAEDRIGLLQQCRSVCDLSSLLGKPTDVRAQPNYPAFVRTLLAQVAQFVNRKEQGALLPMGQICQAVTAAEPHLHLRENPVHLPSVDPYLFAPPQVQVELANMVANCPGSGGIKPVASDNPDPGSLAIMQLVSGFGPGDLMDAQSMEESYNAISKTSAGIFLDLPNHGRTQIARPGVAHPGMTLMALGRALSCVAEIGHGFELSDQPLTRDVSDKVQRRRIAYDALVKGDNESRVKQAEKAKIRELGGNDGYAPWLQQRIEQIYANVPDSDDEHARLLRNERELGHEYVRTLK